MRIGIYNPYLHVFGGGEKVVCVMADALSRLGHDVDIITTAVVSKKKLEHRFNVNLADTKIKLISNQPTIEWNFGENTPQKKKFFKILNIYRNSKFTKKYHIFIILTNEIPIPSLSKFNMLCIQFPFEKEINENEMYKYGKFDLAIRLLFALTEIIANSKGLESIFQKGFYIVHIITHANILKKLLQKLLSIKNFDQKLKTITMAWLRNRMSPLRFDYFNKIVCYSDYVKRWIQKYWKVTATVLHPPVERFSPLKKENYILSVGRFFPGGHNKKHIEMIRTFKELYQKGFTDWEYHLIGTSYIGFQEYLLSVKREATGYPIFIHTDVLFTKLQELYGMSKIFWHGTGYGEDEEVNPERFEHFGLTTGEAMSAQCIPIVFNGGGQPEIVEHGINGFLWNNLTELKEYTEYLMQNKLELQKFGQQAQNRFLNFERESFERKLRDLIKRRRISE